MTARQQASEPKPTSDVSPRMLLITACASALAALITSSFWSGGTVLTAAFTPVFVAVVKEGLRRPTERVHARMRTGSESALRHRRKHKPEPKPAPEPARRPPPPHEASASTPIEAVEARDLPDAEHSGPGDWTEITLRHDPGDPLEAPPEPASPPEPAAPAPPPPASHGRRRFEFHMTRRGWKVALITGGLGFLIAAAVITLPELVFGKPLTGDSSLTYFPNTKVSSTRTTDKTTSTTSTKSDTTATGTTPTDTTATGTTGTDTTGTDTTGTTATGTTTQGAQPSIAPPPAPNTTTGTSRGTGTTGTGTSSGSSP